VQLGVVVKEFQKMRELFKRSVTAALSLILGAGALCSRAAPLTVADGNPSTGGGRQISPNPGISLNIAESNSSQTLVIQSESATFDNGGPLNVTFKQLGDDATAQVWPGFAPSLTGSASFESLSNMFVPSPGSGIDYNMAFLGVPKIVRYSGTQLNGAVSTWGAVTNNDELLIATDPSDDTADYSTSFLLNQTPIVGEVRAPLAVWQSLTGLLFVIFITTIRPAKPASIA
jgi:hypothetical protein